MKKVTAMISYRNKSETKYLFMATKQGMVKKTELSAYMNVRSNGLAAIALREEDELIGVKASRGTEDVLLVTQNGQSITLSEEQSVSQEEIPTVSRALHSARAMRSSQCSLRRRAKNF